MKIANAIIEEMEGMFDAKQANHLARFFKTGKGEYGEGDKFFSHPHDLIHKATGWMLREVGKRGGMRELVKFLEKYKSVMPRTMLRYAIERFPEEERKYFMAK